MRVESVEYMPEHKEDGVLYVSERFELAIHKCPCGCGIQTVTPLGPDEWKLTGGVRPTLRPSMLNKSCGSHYYLTDGEIVWL